MTYVLNPKDYESLQETVGPLGMHLIEAHHQDPLSVLYWTKSETLRRHHERDDRADHDHDGLESER